MATLPHGAKVAQPVKFANNTSEKTPPPEYLEAIASRARLLVEAVRENLLLVSNPPREARDYELFAAFETAKEFEGAVQPRPRSGETLVFAGWHSRVWSTYLRLIAAVEQLFEHYQWRLALEREGSIQPRPLTAPPLDPSILSDVEQGCDQLRRHLSQNTFPPSGNPEISDDRTPIPSGPRPHVRGPKQMTWQEALKLGEQICAGGVFPGVNALMYLIRQKTGRTCSKATTIRAIKNSAKLRMMQAANQDKRKSVSAVEMTRNESSSQTTEQDPVEGLAMAELREKQEAIDNDPLLHALMKEVSDKDRERLLRDVPLNKMREMATVYYNDPQSSRRTRGRPR